MIVHPSAVPGKWSAIAGAGIAAVGLVLLIAPVGEKGGAAVAGFALLAAGLLEAMSGFKSSRRPVRRIELMLSLVTLGAALLVLLRPEAYPLLFVAITCLAARGVGAVVAASHSEGPTRLYVLARGIADLVLAAILVAGAPLASLITMVSARSWPPDGAAVLANFVALSMMATGLSLLGVSRAARPAAGATPAETSAGGDG